mmetsp:Transcript_14619/g.37849  ORF Transcript_14619/g.37849 Transcript_14619/m.37849 type:complete len:390 (-) Transcript_14619:336-1505(-)|eukprot:CAMPEP_0183561754 /NCGR_PEP_ID=MMETSP0371-20130417/96951_1 /TAXON_ID=268820 /ORGANISM="Peridinium aciculiferum, Strain PAER-2" /LENGTH=389 /DNA_ID=CAMNT_0025770337 /DNA_START=59 /DNA_END=1228 /DNA_ORIENTATION=-
MFLSLFDPMLVGALALVSVEGRLGEKKAEPPKSYALPLFSSSQVFVSFVGLELGTPGQTLTLLLDTGSPLFWARSIPEDGCGAEVYSPSASSSAQPRAASAEFGYGSGVVSGPEYSDTLAFLTDNQTFVAAGRVDVVAADVVEGMDCQVGLLGMDMASTSAAQIFESLALHHVFSILLNPVPYSADAGWLEAGTMTLGGVDHTKYSGGMACVPMLPLEKRVNASASDLNPQGVPLNNTAWWQLDILGVRVGSQEFGGGQGIVDSGTSAFIVSPAVMAHFQPLLGNISCLDVEAISALPPVVFTLAGGLEVSVGPEQYLQPAFSQSTTADCLVMSSLPDAPSDDFFVLGVPFFWKYYVAFDYTTEQVGMGLKSGMQGAPLSQSCGAPLAK